MKTKMLLLGLLFLGFAAGVRADDAPAKVPFDTLKTQHIVVMIKINGKGPYRVIFDTGAPFSLIGTKVAEDSGLVQKGKAIALPLFGGATYKMKTLELGGVKAQNVSAMVMDHPTVAAIDKVLGPVEGIIGLSFFGKYRMTIDYQAKEMTFVPVNYDPPDVIKSLMKSMMSTPQKKLLAPAGQWGFSVAKDGQDMQAGVNVQAVLPDSPAAKAGLKVGDRLLTLDGRWTDTVADCYLAASFVRPGSAARVLVVREGKEVELTVRVQAGI